MDILILGGTQFVGRALTEAALKNGHKVTLFNRGKTNQDIFPQVEKLVGDRDGGLEALHGRTWDAVIDTCGYVPRLVRDSAELLQNNTRQYLFISSISVFASMAPVGMDEAAPLGTMPNDDNTVEEINGETYGPLKVLCEDVVRQFFPSNHLIIRPGLITGPHDHTDRFGYWGWRVAQGGDVLVPGRAERPIQHIDVRDLAEWCIALLEEEQRGIYNATGPDYTLTMGELINACLAISESNAMIHWVDEQFVLDSEVKQWQELPIWIPESAADYAGFLQINCQKAIEAGLVFRPVQETVADCLAWHNTREDHVWQNTLKSEKEQEVLAQWSGRDR